MISFLDVCPVAAETLQLLDTLPASDSMSRLATPLEEMEEEEKVAVKEEEEIQMELVKEDEEEILAPAHLDSSLFLRTNGCAR